MRVIQALYKYALPSTDGVRVSCGELLRDANGLVLVSFPFAFTETANRLWPGSAISTASLRKRTAASSGSAWKTCLR